MSIQKKTHYDWIAAFPTVQVLKKNLLEMKRFYNQYKKAGAFVYSTKN